MDHVMTVIDLGRDKRHRRQLCSRCSCGYLTPVTHSVADNDDEMEGHARIAKRERLGLGVKTPSLKTTLKHYETMAAHPACTVPERTQWSRLAEEVRERLRATTKDDELGQDSLLDLMEEKP